MRELKTVSIVETAIDGADSQNTRKAVTHPKPPTELVDVAELPNAYWPQPNQAANAAAEEDCKDVKRLDIFASRKPDAEYEHSCHRVDCRRRIEGSNLIRHKAGYPSEDCGSPASKSASLDLPYLTAPTHAFIAAST